MARAFADRAMTEAVGLDRAREYGEAGRALLAVADRMSGYAGRDQVLRSMVAELRRGAEE